MPTSFRLYNTKTRTVEDFTPQAPGQVGIYVCGMTVYARTHVGHARAMVVFDAFVRWLRHEGWAVRFVRNFTDIDDKIIARAATLGIDPATLAQDEIDADMVSLDLDHAEAARLAPVRTRVAEDERNPADPSTWGKVARNAQCPCGSGKKYKHCHGRH